MHRYSGVPMHFVSGVDTTLLIKRGAKGEGGAKPDARSVYVFKMAKHTSPAK